jgi:hypothetical protein
MIMIACMMMSHARPGRPGPARLQLARASGCCQAPALRLWQHQAVQWLAVAASWWGGICMAAGWGCRGPSPVSAGPCSQLHTLPLLRPASQLLVGCSPWLLGLRHADLDSHDLTGLRCARAPCCQLPHPLPCCCMHSQPLGPGGQLHSPAGRLGVRLFRAGYSHITRPLPCAHAMRHAMGVPHAVDMNASAAASRGPCRLAILPQPWGRAGQNQGPGNREISVSVSCCICSRLLPKDAHGCRHKQRYCTKPVQGSNQSHKTKSAATSGAGCGQGCCTQGVAPSQRGPRPPGLVRPTTSGLDAAENHCDAAPKLAAVLCLPATAMLHAAACACCDPCQLQCCHGVLPVLPVLPVLC